MNSHPVRVSFLPVRACLHPVRGVTIRSQHPSSRCGVGRSSSPSTCSWSQGGRSWSPSTFSRCPRAFSLCGHAFSTTQVARSRCGYTGFWEQVTAFPLPTRLLPVWGSRHLVAGSSVIVRGRSDAVRRKEREGTGSVCLGTVRLLPGRGCLNASRWSSFPVPVCFLMVPRSKQPITGSLLPASMRLFPATSRSLPGTWCTAIEVVYELSTSGCGFVDTTLGIHGSRSKHPGTLGGFTASVPALPASTCELPDPLRLLPHAANSLPSTVRLDASTRRFFTGAVCFRLGTGNEHRGPGCAGAVQATGFMVTRRKLPRFPRRLQAPGRELIVGWHAAVNRPRLRTGSLHAATWRVQRRSGHMFSMDFSISSTN